MKLDLQEFASHLFGQMKCLKENKITVEEANAQSGLARQANNAINHEWKRSKKVANCPGEEE